MRLAVQHRPPHWLMACSTVTPPPSGRSLQDVSLDLKTRRETEQPDLLTLSNLLNLFYSYSALRDVKAVNSYTWLLLEAYGWSFSWRACGNTWEVEHGSTEGKSLFIIIPFKSSTIKAQKCPPRNIKRWEWLVLLHSSFTGQSADRARQK